MNARSTPRVLMALVATVFLGGCADDDVDPEATTPTEVRVRVATVARVTLRARVDAYGVIEPEPAGGGAPAGSARLAAPAPGIVRAVPVREGQGIEAGTIVVRLDDRVALAQLDKTQHLLEFAEQQVARENRLEAVDGTSQKAVQEAAQQLASARADVAAARAQLALVQLTTPIAGVVVAIHVQPGQTVEPSTVLAEIVDLNRLVLTVQVPSSEAASVERGQPAEISDEGRTAVARGEVLFVSPRVNPRTATVLVRLSVSGSSGLRPGQFAHVQIVTEERVNRLAVPHSALYTDHDGRSTLSVVEGDVAKRRVVDVGLRDGDLVEIEGEGLVEGTTVVTIGSYALPDDTKVRVLGEPETPGAAR